MRYYYAEHTTEAQKDTIVEIAKSFDLEPEISDNHCLIFHTTGTPSLELTRTRVKTTDFTSILYEMGFLTKNLKAAMRAALECALAVQTDVDEELPPEWTPSKPATIPDTVLTPELESPDLLDTREGRPILIHDTKRSKTYALVRKYPGFTAEQFWERGAKEFSRHKTDVSQALNGLKKTGLISSKRLTGRLRWTITDLEPIITPSWQFHKNKLKRQAEKSKKNIRTLPKVSQCNQIYNYMIEKQGWFKSNSIKIRLNLPNANSRLFELKKKGRVESRKEIGCTEFRALASTKKASPQ